MEAASLVCAVDERSPFHILSWFFHPWAADPCPFSYSDVNLFLFCLFVPPGAPSAYYLLHYHSQSLLPSSKSC